MSSSKNNLVFRNLDDYKAYCSENPKKCLLIYKGDVFDVTEFLGDHPGGPEIIEDLKGGDISEVFHAEYSHKHSDTALRMLLRYKIGTIEDSNGNPAEQEPKKVAYPIITDTKVEYNDFTIDLTRGMCAQVLHLTKKQYIHMIENSIYLPYCRLFDGAFFEACSRTKWWMIPMIWVPVLLYIFYLALFVDYESHTFLDKYIMVNHPDFSPVIVGLFTLLGIGLWTFGEYMLHRYAFHFEKVLPENPYFFYLHFIIHGIHHTIPMDPDRLVFPPALGIITFFPLYGLITFLFPGNIGRLLFAGFGIGYIGYDMTHYFIHHGTPKMEHFKEMKKYHHKHHYIDGDRGYGITSKFWDKVFNTELV